MKAADVMADVVARLVAQIEAGASDWSMPWRKITATGWPTNATTGARYGGANAIALWFEAERQGFASSRYATYRQWAEVGVQVLRGERGTHLVYWHQPSRSNDQSTEIDTNESDDNDGAVTGSSRRGGWARSFVVFNAAQTDTDDTATADVAVDVGCVARDVRADEVLGAVPVEVRWGRGRAAYHPAGDFVTMPAFDTFTTTEDAYATLCHELAHATGHPSRLNRTFGRRFGDHAYAAEELVAEISAAFTCATLGIDTVARTDHAAYLASWCAMLRAQPAVLWSVASKAQAATDHLLAYHQSR